MTELIFYIPNFDMQNTLNVLQQLPQHLRPLYYSTGEYGKKSKNKVSEDKEKFNKFVSKNLFGFFLFAEQVRFNIISFTREGHAWVMVDDQRNKGSLTFENVLLIADVLLKLKPHFAFAADWEEYLHRNMYVGEDKTGRIEKWVGRELGKQFPGVYWVTIFPSQHTEITKSIEKYLNADIINLHGYYLARAYDFPQNWKKHSERIDKYLFENPLFFSKMRVQDKLDELLRNEENFLKFIDKANIMLKTYEIEQSPQKEQLGRENV